MKNTTSWTAFILSILLFDPCISLCMLMLITLLLVYEKDIYGTYYLKTHNLDNKTKKNEYYKQINKLYKQKENHQSNYKFLEPSQTEVTDKEEEEDKKHHSIKRKQLIHLKLFCIYFLYGIFLFIIRCCDNNDIYPLIPEITIIFSILILIGLFLKSNFLKLKKRVIILLIAFIPMLFTGISFYLLIAQPQNYKYIQSFLLSTIEIMVFVLLFILIKTEIHDKKK